MDTSVKQKLNINNRHTCFLSTSNLFFKNVQIPLKQKGFSFLAAASISRCLVQV